jgi:hypothetical protein
MKSVNYLIIKAEVTHKEQEGSIILQTRFENQGKAKQFFPIVAVPERLKGQAEVGDMLCVHFNIVVFDRRNGVNKKGKYYIKDDMYIVPDDMAHFILREDGSIKFFEDDCLIDGILGNDEVVLDSGIVLPDVRESIQKKQDLMRGTVYAKSDAMHDVEIGDKVRLSDHSDYEIEFPDGTKRWFVNYNSMLYKYEDG